ncbi:MAG: hypothetical protein GXO62_04085 [Epsilonproteobacteria bacterium]|nr:hypothetical protein [Campylobacterota bacterium]
MQEAIEKGNYKQVRYLLDKIFSSPSFNERDMLEGILFKDVKAIVDSKEKLENILLSTKVIVEDKKELLEFFDMLLKYGFKENALNYFEELLGKIDEELIHSINSLFDR